MKTMNTISRMILLVVALLVVAYSLPVVAQEMTKDEWQAQMTSLTAKRTDLQAQLTKLAGDLTTLKAQSDKADADVKACEEALFALLGVTRADVEAYDKELSDMEKRVGE